jgi:cytoskeleton protein RodZ
VSVGEALIRAREAAGLSLEDVAAQTKIRTSILAAMESDDFSVCGGDAYARGQLRSIAQVIGLDPVSVVALYDAEYADGAGSGPA